MACCVTPARPPGSTGGAPQPIRYPASNSQSGEVDSVDLRGLTDGAEAGRARQAGRPIVAGLIGR